VEALSIIDLKVAEKVAYLTIKSPPANALSSKSLQSWMSC